MTSTQESHPDSSAPFQALTGQHVLLLRHSASAVGIDRCRTVAESIYAQLGDVPGAGPFLYDLPVRIRSTARFLGVLIALIGADPFDTGRLEVEFAAVGRSHARAGLPPVLLDLGAAVFVRCMAAAAADNRQPWTTEDMSAWDILMRAGVEVQKRAYAWAAPQDPHARPAVTAPSSSVAPGVSSAPEPGISAG